MADNIGDIAGGLRDFADKSFQEAPSKTSAALNELGQSLGSAGETVYTVQAKMRAMGDELDSQVKSLRKLADTNSAYEAPLRDAIRLQIEFAAKQAEANKALSSATSSMKSFEEKVALGALALDALRTATVSSGEELSRHLTRDIGYAAGAARAGLMTLGTAGTVVGIVLVGAAAALAVFVEATDAATKAQRGAVNSLLQSGSTPGNINHEGVKSILDAGAASGYSPQESGKLATSMAEAGVEIRKGSSASKTYTTAVELSAETSRAFGLSLEQTGGLATMMGAKFRVSGEDMTHAFGTVVKGQKDSGIQMGAFLKVFSSVADLFSQFGESIDSATSVAARWAKEVTSGTVSVSALNDLYDVQSGNSEEQMQRMMLIRTFDPKGAAALGITGGDPTQDWWEMKKHGDAFSKEGMGIEWAKIAAQQAAGGASAPIGRIMYFFDNLTKGAFKSAESELSAYNNPKAAAEAIKGNKNIKTPEEIMMDVVKDANIWMGKFSTSGEHLETALRFLTEAVNGLRMKLDFNTIANKIEHPLSTVSDFAVQHRSGIASMITGGSSQLIELAMSMFGGRASGGLIGKTGMYRMHAGEMVHRAGEGDGMTVNAGGISVSVGSYGDVGGALDSALAKLKVEILSEIEEQWRRAQYA